LGTAADQTFRLGPWTVRPLLGEISGVDGTHRLEPKVMGVLVFLARQAGQVATRDQLVEAVWDGRIVSDEVISRCISLLRSKLGDDSKNPRFIKTVPKIGYQLLEDVEWSSAVDPQVPVPMTVPPAKADPGSQEKSRKSPGRWIASSAILGALLLAALVAMTMRDEGTQRDGDMSSTLAVLPFANLGDDPENEYLSDGLTEDLIAHLAGIEDLRVVASTSSFRFKDNPDDIRSIARQLNVKYILNGSVQRDDDEFRIRATLTDANSGIVEWSDQFDRPLGDFFTVQDEISQGIAEELLPRLSPGDAKQVAVAAPTSVMPAYELLLRGRFHLRTREQGPILRSIELFEQAIELDPHLGEAYRELARAYALLPTYSAEDPDEMFALAEETLERCLVMDPSMERRLLDVRAFLHFARWEWIEAEETFRQALEVYPNDPTLHQWYSQLLAAVGKPELALQAVLRAKELDILSPTVNHRLAVVYQWVDDDAHAYRQFELAQELGLGPRANPEAYVIQLFRREEFDEARQILVDLQHSLGLPDEWVDPFIASLKDPLARPAAAQALSGIAEEQQISLKYLQGAYVYLGYADAAIDVAFLLLDDPLNFEVEFLFARENAVIRNNPRFGELVRAIGLDRYWDVYGWPRFCSRDEEAIICH